MEPQPIPLEELKPGAFYDIQSSDESPRVLGALLLQQFPNGQVKLMFLSASGFDRFSTKETELVLVWRAFQIETIQLDTVFPYQAYSQIPDKVLQWPRDFEGEELIAQISEEMYRAVREDHWTFNLPNFCEGYLYLYVSYFHRIENSQRRQEMADLWIDFMCGYFSALRNYILRIKLLPTQTISDLLKGLKGMYQMSLANLEIRSTPDYSEKEGKLAQLKKSFFEAYRPIELSSDYFDSCWDHILDYYRQDLITWQLQEPLSVRSLFLDSDKFSKILNYSPSSVEKLMNVDFPGLNSEENIRFKVRIAAVTDDSGSAEYLFEQTEVEPETLSRIILEENLLYPILKKSNERMQTFVMTRTDLFPLVLALLKSKTDLSISFLSFIKCVTTRIALDDFSFVTFVIEREFLSPQISYSVLKQTYGYLKELIQTSGQHRMNPQLLRTLLPYGQYYWLIILVFANLVTRPGCREMMLCYYMSEEICLEEARSFMSKVHI